MIDKNKLGLTFGLFFAIVHAFWAFMVAIIPNQLQSFLNWIFNIHFLEPVWNLIVFNIFDAMLLVIMTFIVGYILGWVFAWVHNLYHKKK